MEKFIKYLRIIILLIFCITDVLESTAQSYYKIEYPYINSSTADNVYIKNIEFTSYQTKIDFIACYSGNYIFLEKAGQRNAMYIRIGNYKYKLRETYGIASTDKVTYCQPRELLEFSAIFDPIPDKERDNFDLIEGIDGTWNFYQISISKYLSRHKVPDWVKYNKEYSKEVKIKEEVKIEYPYVVRQFSPYIIMTKIEKLIDCTKIHLYYRTPKVGWLNINNKIYIQTPNGTKYNLLHPDSIPKHYFHKIGESVIFCLNFPKLSNDVDSFVLSESTTDEFFFHVELRSDFKSYIARCSNMKLYFNENDDEIQEYGEEEKQGIEEVPKNIKESTLKQTKKTVKKKLEKDPNFRID